MAAYPLGVRRRMSRLARPSIGATATFSIRPLRCSAWITREPYVDVRPRCVQNLRTTVRAATAPIAATNVSTAWSKPRDRPGGRRLPTDGGFFGVRASRRGTSLAVCAACASTLGRSAFFVGVAVSGSDQSQARVEPLPTCVPHWASRTRMRRCCRKSRMVGAGRGKLGANLAVLLLRRLSQIYKRRVTAENCAPPDADYTPFDKIG